MHAHRCNGTLHTTRVLPPPTKHGSPSIRITNYKEINAEHSLNDKDSIYNFFKQLIRLRKGTPALIYGDYVDIDPQHPTVFAFTRTLEGDRYLILLNFSNRDTAYELPANVKAEQILLSNVRVTDEDLPFIKLRCWEARLYKI